jgi:transposase
MPTSFLPYEPNQEFLPSPSLSEWLPENHLVYFVSETVDRLDLQRFYARYEGEGRRNQPYEPALLVKVLVYGYATGVFSSRKMARKLDEDVAFRILREAISHRIESSAILGFGICPRLKSCLFQAARRPESLAW